jgi:hypothetical protein
VDEVPPDDEYHTNGHRFRTLAHARMLFHEPVSDWTCAPRSLTEAEAEALECLLRADFPGVHELREQAPIAKVVGGCGCGCPTVRLEVDHDPVSPTPATSGVVSSHVLDEEGADLLLFVRDGRLSMLELSWIEEPPASFPSCDRVGPPKWEPGL